MSDDSTPLQNVSFPSNGGQAHGYLKTPESGSGPGLIVIQEWWGLDDSLAEVTDRFASDGFVALAPDLYGGRAAHDSDEAGEMMEKLPVDQAARDLGGAVDYLLGLDSVTSSKVGVVGFCMGGSFALRLGVQQGDKIGAVVPFYGVGPLPDDYSGITAPIQGHYGEQDTFYPADQAREQEQTIRSQAGVPVEFFFYPAGHAFMNPKDRMGTYDRPAAELAWGRAVEFLRTNLS